MFNIIELNNYNHNLKNFKYTITKLAKKLSTFLIKISKDYYQNNKILVLS